MSARDEGVVGDCVVADSVGNQIVFSCCSKRKKYSPEFKLQPES
jgi:hypothetical protein